jgi:hypothetical protein
MEKIKKEDLPAILPVRRGRDSCADYEKGIKGKIEITYLE